MLNWGQRRRRKKPARAFHQTQLVLVDPETLRTLPDRDFCEGFAEAIKHTAIRDAEMLSDLVSFVPSGRDVPAELIARNIAIKASIVEADEHETLGIRAQVRQSPAS